MMLTKRRWIIPENDAKGTLLERVLAARGLSDDVSRQAFLTADYPEPDPFLFTEMETACRLIIDNIKRSGSILVFSDYDCDGLTAAAILYRFFGALGTKIRLMMPDRASEGYGLKMNHVEAIISDPPSLLITVDNGTTSREEVARLRAAGITVIVTDHHRPGDFPAEANAHLNPVRDTGNDPGICGAGVALLLCEALIVRWPKAKAEISPKILRTLRILAAIGTVADVMPLTGVNRKLVRGALSYFACDAPQGLLSLCGEKRDPANLTARDIAFFIGPRINAASRIGDASTALKLLITDDRDEAFQLASKLEAWNEQRRKIEDEMTRQAVEKAAISDDLTHRLVIAGGENWHAGVIGIVASRLVSRFGKPSLVISDRDGCCQGSARSFGGFDITALLSSQSAYLESVGGHQHAAGISLLSGQLNNFITSLHEAAARLPYPERSLSIDAILQASDLTEQRLSELSLLEPIGFGNEAVQCLLPGAKIKAITLIGDLSHVRFSLSFQGQRFDAVGFRLAIAEKIYRVGDLIDLIVRPSWRFFRDVGSVDLKIVDIRPSGSDRKEAIFEKDEAEKDFVLHKSVFAHLFNTLRRYESELLQGFLGSRMARLIERDYNVSYTAEEIAAALKILDEAGVGKLSVRGALVSFRIFQPDEAAGKPLLNETKTYRVLEEKGRVIG